MDFVKGFEDLHIVHFLPEIHEIMENIINKSGDLLEVMGL